MLQHLKGYQRSITLIKTGRLNKKTTQILIHKKKRKETGAETNISMWNSSASTNTNTYTINRKSSIRYIHPGFLNYSESTTILTYSEKVHMPCNVTCISDQPKRYWRPSESLHRDACIFCASSEIGMRLFHFYKTTLQKTLCREFMKLLSAWHCLRGNWVLTAILIHENLIAFFNHICKNVHHKN